MAAYASELKNGAAATYTYSFEVISTDYVRLALKNSEGVFENIPTDHGTHPWTVDSATSTITMSGTQFPSGTGNVRVSRDTPLTDIPINFNAGSALTAAQLNENFQQGFDSQQEVKATFVNAESAQFSGTVDINTNNIINSGDIVFEGTDHDTTLTIAEPGAARTITLPNVTGTVITTGDSLTIATGMIANDAINADKIADDVINSEHYAAGSIDLEHMSANSVDSDQYVDGSIDSIHLAADVIDGTKLADNAVDSEHYTDGSIDRVHLAADIVDGSKIADDSIDSEHIAADSIDSEHYAAGSVDNTALANDAVNGAKIADNAIDSEHYVDGSIDRVHLAADIVDGTKLADDAVDSEHYTDGSIDRVHLAADIVDGTKIADDSINSEHYVDGSIDRAHLSADLIDATKIDDDAVDTEHIANNAVEADQLATNAVTNAKIADDAVTAAKIDNLTASITELNQLHNNTLSNSGVDWTSGTTFPSASQISARLELFGGFEAIDDDESFPNTAPAEGVIISIADAGGLEVNSSGTSTNGDTLDDTQVTINQFPTGFNSTTLDDGIGLLVVKDSGTGHTYNFHRVVAKDEDVRQLSSDMNDFKARYRTGTDNPTTNNDAGDLFFNTGSNKMLVRNGTNDAWEEVQSIGEFHIIPDDEFPTWDGSINDIEDISNAPANAQQILLSIEGVIQEPKSGTTRPTDGFALSGSTILLSEAPQTGDSVFGVILGSTVNIGTPSANTVSTDKIQDDAVTGDKIEANVDLDGNPTTTTQSSGNDSTRIATTAFVQDALSGISSDAISEGDSSAEIVDSGSSHFKVVLDNDERFRIETTNGNATFDGSLTVDGMHFGHGNDDASLNSNVAIGLLPLENATSNAANNISIGNEAGRGVTDASHCIFMGFRSGQNGTLTGDNNIGIGNEALQDASSGFGNVAIGREAAQNLTTGDRNVFVGSLCTSSGVVTGDNNVCIGQSAGQSLTSGTENVIIGSGAAAVTEGDENIIIGDSAGQGITTGSNNTIIGGPTSSLGNISDTMVLGIQGTERIRVNDSGKVGIGTTGPIFDLDVVSGTDNTGANANNPSQLSVTGPNKGLTAGGATVFINSNSDMAADTGGSLSFTGRTTSSATTSTAHAVIKGAKENGTSTNVESYLAFAVSNHAAGGLVERQRIDSQGQATFTAQAADHNNFTFGISDDAMGTDTKHAILVSGSNGGTRLGIKRPSGTSGNVSYLECRRGNNGISAISVNEAGNVIISGTADIDQGSSYGTVVGSQSSDQRLKNSITDYTGGLSLVNALRPVNFKYNDDNTVHAGFIAQEVQSVIPEAVYDTNTKPNVYGEEDGRKVITGQDDDADNLLAMHYVEIIPALVNSIKELKAEVDTLKTKVAALEAK